MGYSSATPLSIDVGRNVQISLSDFAKIHTETVLGADPADAHNLVSCAMQWAGQNYNAPVSTVVFVSTDGGARWLRRLSLPTQLAPGIKSADPYCSFTFHHRIVFAEHEVVENSYGAASIAAGETLTNLVFVSADLGKTWTAAGTLPFGDRPFIAVDRSPSHDNALFVAMNAGHLEDDAGDRLPSIEIYKSSADVLHFEPWLTYVSRNYAEIFDGGIDVLPDGRAITAGLGAHRKDSVVNGQGSIFVLIPTRDASTAVDLAAERPRPVSETYGCSERSYSPYPALAVDHSDGPFRGRVYVSWSDHRFGHCRILLSWSDDGESWSRSRVVDHANDADYSGDDFQPALVVNDRGILGVTWQDRFDEPTSLGWRVRFAFSADGGQTFSNSVNVSTSPMTVAGAAPYALYGEVSGAATPKSPNDVQLTFTSGIAGHPVTGGETVGFDAAPGGVFHAAWIDNRTGVMQIWTAPITVSAYASANGEDFQGYRNIATSAILEVASERLDPKTETLAAVVDVRNVSDRMISGPIRLRLLELAPRIGRIEVLDANNGVTGEGAYWVLLRADETPLAPHAKSGSKTLHFRFVLKEPLNAYALRLENGPNMHGEPLIDMVTMKFAILGLGGSAR